jgi:uncharacterized protein (DUF983 family)
MATNEAVRLAADDDRAPGEAPAVKRGVGFGHLVCPECGEEAVFTVALTDLDTLACCECSTEFDRAGVREWVAARVAELGRWEAVLGWLDAAPAAA